MKKIIKVLVGLLLLILILLISIPLLFKKQITEIVTQEINNSVNAKVDFKDLSISFLSSFPSASIKLSEFTIITYAPFEKDTLLYSKEILMNTSIPDLIANNPKIKDFSLEKALINIHTNKEGQSNYDVAKKTEKQTTAKIDTTKTSDFSLEIDNYRFNSIDFNYIDNTSNMIVNIKNFNHRGNGKFSTQNMILETGSTIEELTVSIDNITYLNKINIDLKADLEVDLETYKTTFKKNKLLINDLGISFDGFVQPMSDGILMDLEFGSLEAKFKNLLSLVPSAYDSNFKGLTANGVLSLEGIAKGNYSETEIPKFSVLVSSKDAFFKYTELPKPVEHINVVALIENSTGKADDTKVVIENFDFQIDKDIFSSSVTFTKLNSNPTVRAKMNGIINLNNLSKAYPMNMEQKIQGVLKANLNTSFNKKAIENNKYEQIKNIGTVALENFTTSTNLLPNPIKIRNAVIKFNPKSFSLTNFKAVTGTSDLSIKGNIDNLYGYLFGDKDLKGDFSISSKKLDVSDLVSVSDTVTTKKMDTTAVSERVKIPKKIDITVKAEVEKILYDNLTLNSSRGILIVKDQKAILKKVTAKMLKGSIGIDGKVDTKPTIGNFDLKLKIKDFDIASSFDALEIFSLVAPFMKAVEGKISTFFDVKGPLKTDFSPDTKSMSGNASADIEITKIDEKKSKVVELLDSELSFFKFSKLNMKNMRVQFSFANEKVKFKPFKVASYEGIPISIEGSHSFGNKIDYKLKMDLPAKYMGNEVDGLLSGLSSSEKNNTRVPLVINIGGTVTKPTVKPDMKKAIASLTSKIISSQKSKLIDKLLKNNSNKKGGNSNQKDRLKKEAENILKELF